AIPGALGRRQTRRPDRYARMKFKSSVLAVGDGSRFPKFSKAAAGSPTLPKVPSWSLLGLSARAQPHQRARLTGLHSMPRQIQRPGLSHLEARVEWAAFTIEHLPQPCDIRRGWPVQPEIPDLERDQPEAGQLSGLRVERGEIHEDQVVAIFFMTRDAFVIVDEVATAIEDQLASVDLDRLG